MSEDYNGEPITRAYERLTGWLGLAFEVPAKERCVIRS
jgi:hypothetical protein